MAVGLVYIGAAFATVNQPTPQVATQQFTAVPAASELTSGVNKNISSSSAVLGQNITSSAAAVPSPVFIPECTYKSIPYQTVYKTAAWLEVGRTITTGGIDGEEKSCSNQAGPPTITAIISPLDKTVTTGTLPQTYFYTGHTDSDNNSLLAPSPTGSPENPQ